MKRKRNLDKLYAIQRGPAGKPEYGIYKPRYGIYRGTKSIEWIGPERRTLKKAVEKILKKTPSALIKGTARNLYTNRCPRRKPSKK